MALASTGGISGIAAGFLTKMGAMISGIFTGLIKFITIGVGAVVAFIAGLPAAAIAAIIGVLAAGAVLLVNKITTGEWLNFSGMVNAVIGWFKRVAGRLINWFNGNGFQTNEEIKDTIKDQIKKIREDSDRRRKETIEEYNKYIESVLVPVSPAVKLQEAKNRLKIANENMKVLRAQLYEIGATIRRLDDLKIKTSYEKIWDSVMEMTENIVRFNVEWPKTVEETIQMEMKSAELRQKNPNFNNWLDRASDRLDEAFGSIEVSEATAKDIETKMNGFFQTLARSSFKLAFAFNAGLHKMLTLSFNSSEKDVEGEILRIRKMFEEKRNQKEKDFQAASTAWREAANNLFQHLQNNFGLLIDLYKEKMGNFNWYKDSLGKIDDTLGISTPKSKLKDAEDKLKLLKDFFGSLQKVAKWAKGTEGLPHNFEKFFTPEAQKELYKEIARAEIEVFNQKMMNLNKEREALQENQKLIEGYIKRAMEFKPTGVEGIEVNTMEGYKFLTSSVGRLNDLGPVLQNTQNQQADLQKRANEIAEGTKSSVDGIYKKIEQLTPSPFTVIKLIN